MAEPTTDPAIAPMRADERRAVGVVSLIAMLRMLGLFALLPVLSLYAASLAGATPLLIGLAVGVYGLTQAGLQVPLGALSDRLGRKPVIIGGLAVFALGSAVAAFSDSITGVIVGRALQGAGAISATLTALVADLTRPETRTRSMALVGISIGAAFVLAIVVGPLFAATLGVRALFGFGVVAAGAAVALLWLLPAAPAGQTVTRSWNFRLAVRPDLLRLDLYVFLLHAIMTASFVALPFLLASGLDMAITSHWKMYVGALAVSLAGTIPLILDDERRGRARTIGVAVVLLLGGELILTFGGFSQVAVFAGLAVFFAGFNFL